MLFIIHEIYNVISYINYLYTIKIHNMMMNANVIMSLSNYQYEAITFRMHFYVNIFLTITVVERKL